MGDSKEPLVEARSLMRRRIVFAVVCVGCLALVIAYAFRASSRRAALFAGDPLPPISSLSDLGRPTVGGSNVDAESDPPLTGDAPRHDPVTEGEEAVETGPRPVEPLEQALLVRHTGLDASHGVMSVVRLSSGGEDRRGTPLRCDRLDFAWGRGVCLATDRFYTTHSIMVFDRSFTPLHTLPLNGIPSRVRLSRDGRRAAVTVFVSGHSYADDGFSTETSIVDTQTGRLLVESLEAFEVRQRGTRVLAADINFWGVTFADDGDEFYATLGTGGRVYLVHGSVADRRIEILRDGVECPSLSPDQTRIAFKRRVPSGASFVWRLYVLDLSTSAETPLAETRHVDDQVAWLDDTTVLYALADESAPSQRVTDVWRVPADGRGTAQVFLRRAFSPAFLRLDAGR